MSNNELEQIAEEFFDFIFNFLKNCITIGYRIKALSDNERANFFQAVDLVMKKSDKWNEIENPEIRQNIVRQLHGEIAKWKAESEIG